jgi:hypothetical protein
MPILYGQAFFFHAWCYWKAALRVPGSWTILLVADNKDDRRRSKSLAERGIHFLDAGVSDGIGGLKVGYCLMIGGEKAVYEKLLSIFETLAPAESYLYGGASAL